MKEIQCYKTNDGSIFEDDNDALVHENEVFTAEIFEIMKLAEFGIDDVNLMRGLRRLTSEDAKKRVLSSVRAIISILTDANG